MVQNIIEPSDEDITQLQQRALSKVESLEIGMISLKQNIFDT